MKEKKRKRSHKEAEEGPAKRVALESSTGSIKVSFVSDVNQWVPVLGVYLTFSCQSLIKPKLKLSSHQSWAFSSSWNLLQAIYEAAPRCAEIV